jgi:gamma-glutamyltranspeptidase/glutathione hydrolase
MQKQNSTMTYDARETAPAAATEDRFEGLDFVAAWQSGLSVGVPGIPFLMEHMHKKYGKLEWSTLFEDAKELAENGFEVTGRIESTTQRLLSLGGVLGGDCVNRVLFQDPVAFEYFVDAETCSAKPQGTVLTNLEYAATLMTLAESGAEGFYQC